MAPPARPDALPGRLLLLGHPVAHSLSPLFQNAALAAATIPLAYEALDVAPDEIASVAADARRKGWAGNITVPHKLAFAAQCDALSADARRAGAVNTFVVRQRKLWGHNTDVGGFDAAARSLLGRSPAGLTVGIVGAGGAARAALTAIERWPGARALVSNRSRQPLERLIADFRTVAQPSGVVDLLARADLVVHATSVGLDGLSMPFDVAALAPHAAVLDLVYAPGETALVHAARAAGHRAMDGLPMLVEQGALAFEIWFGSPPDRSVMWASLAERGITRS